MRQAVPGEAVGAVRAGVGAEVRSVVLRLLNPAIYAAMLAAALLVAVAYQVRPTYDITVGGPTDGPMLVGFNDRERTVGPEALPFRWTTGDSWLVLRDVGRQDYSVALTVNGWRPPGQPPAHLRVEAGGRTLLELDPAPGIATYSFAVPREAVEEGTLSVHLVSNVFSPPGDARQLGVALLRVQMSPDMANPDRFVEPPVGPLIWVAASAGVAGLILSLMGWGAGTVGLGGGLVALLAAWLVAADRLWLTSGRWYEWWTPVLVYGGVFALLAWAVGGRVAGRAGATWTPLQGRVLLTLAFAAFVVRLAGQLHPQIFIVDLGFHVHRLEDVLAGNLLFTIKSAEWGGRSTFYLPTAYLMMMPLYWLVHDKELVIRLFTVGISTLGVVPLFYMVKRATGDGRAGVIASALYLTLPMAVLPFSWGITTNVFGEFFALCALAVAVGASDRLHPTRPAFWALLAVLLVALLSHPGVVQLTVAAFGLISVLWLWRGRTIAHRGAAVWALVALVAAVGLSYALYYRHFAGSMLQTFQDIQAERAGTQAGEARLRVGGSVADRSLGLVVSFVSTRSEWLVGNLRAFWQEAQAYYRVWPLVGAVPGYLLLWPGRGRTRKRALAARLALAAVGWALAVVLFALVGLLLNLYVRYMLFALPVVAAGAGILLAALWRRGRYGVVLALLVLAYFAVEALALWHYRINYAFK